MNFFHRLLDYTSTYIDFSPKSGVRRETLIKFISAETWSESRRIVEQNPQLLSDQADAILGQLLSNEIEGKFKQNLFEHRTLLRRCQEIGIQQAFDEQKSTPEPDILQQLESMLYTLSEPAQYTDIPHRTELCYQALALVEQDNHPRLWAALQLELGNNLCQNLVGNKEENVESAIAIYRKILTVINPKSMPIVWAKVMNNLGNAYTDRIHGEKKENIEQAIMAFLGTLSIMNQETRPLEWAQTINNLAFAYINRLGGNQADNIEEAILACQDALNILTRETMPVEWIKAMNNLAQAYRKRGQGDRNQNLEYTIAICQEVLNMIRPEGQPAEWARTMINLADAYQERLLGNREENLQEAMAIYEAALTVATEDEMPMESAIIREKLAHLYISNDNSLNLQKGSQLPHLSSHPDQTAYPPYIA